VEHAAPKSRSRSWLVPPWHSWRARAWWSTAAFVVLLVWQYFILSASVGVFFAPHTPRQMFELVLKAKADDFWPGEFGSAIGLWERLIQIGPAIAALLWLMCLVPWKRRRLRVSVMVFILTLPVAFIGMNWFYTPLLPVYGPYYGLKLLATGGTGKEHEIGGIFVGPALWFWLVLPVVIFAARERRARPGVCPSCGYSLAGLPGPVCPECGAKQSPPAR
jgi:hypothetical protein